MGSFLVTEPAKITKDQLRQGFTDSQWCSACSKLGDYVINEVDWHHKHCGLQPENLRRIHIIGGPGSGKTTLAHEIGACLGIEAHELDQIAFTGRDFAERPISERMADIYLIAHRPAWVTEGLFVLWTDELLASANMIVWLDHVSWKRGFWRITHRFFRSALHEAKTRQGLERFGRFSDYARHMKQLIQVFFSSRAYYAARPSQSGGQMESRSSTAAVLASYQDKVIHCYNDEAVEVFIDYIRLCRRSMNKEKDNGS
jgi:adenylate kinase family enzyme